MFHVKHPGKQESIKPDRLAEATVALVEQALRAIGFAPAIADFYDRIERFAAVLALWGGTTNLTAAPDDPDEMAFHIVDSLAPMVVAGGPESASLRGAFAGGQKIIDLGSGAGFPGLILAAANEAHFTLLEARRKRASFLTVAAAAMGLSNVEVASRYPEELTAGFAVATGRAFAQPPVFYRAAGRALRADGLAILYANPDQALEPEAAALCGLGELQRPPYAIPRGKREVRRVLAVWRRRSD